MAYRQLCAVTFAVLGLVAVGCGGDTNSSASSPPDAQQPPTNPDQPSRNADQASSSDQAPSSTAQAPNNASDPAGTGGGGRAGALCHQLCNSVAQLAGQCGGMATMGETKNLCSADCQLPASYTPCLQEVGDVLACYVDNLAVLCAAASNNQDPPAGDPQPKAAVPCQDTLKVFTKCADAHSVDGDTTGNKPPKCSTGAGCNCTTDCLTCKCQAGTDATKLLACADSCATP